MFSFLIQSKSAVATLAVIVAAFTISANPASAVEIVWDDGDPNGANSGGGDANQLWSMPTNWRFNNGVNALNDTLPGVGDRANIAFDSGINLHSPGALPPAAGPGGAAVIQVGDNISVSSVRVGTNPGLGYGGHGRLDITGGILNILNGGTGDHFILGADGDRTGSVVQTGGTVDFGGAEGGRFLRIGQSNGEGFYSISAGMLKADMGGIVVAADSTASQGTFHISGTASVINTGGNFETAHAGTGRVIMSGGTLDVTSNNLIVNQGGASNGKFTLSGGTIDIENQIRFNGGTGVFEQSGGTVNVGTILDIGNSNGGDGTYRMTGGILNVGDRVNSDLKIGNFNNTSTTALMEIIDGTVNVSRSIRIADNGGNSSGTLIVGDGTTSPTINLNTGAGNNFEVGDNGSATFTFKSGTVNVNQSNFITGQQGSSDSTVTIGGFAAQAKLDIQNDWNTNTGDGDVDIKANGLVELGRHLMLGNNGAQGGLILNIDGGELQVGVNGAGDIIYRAGGPRDQINLKGGVLDLTGGNIRLDGAATSKFSMTGGTLRSVGTFDGTLHQEGGFLDPGASPGPNMVITGDYNLDTLGTYIVEVGPDHILDIDFLDIGGEANIGGTIKLVSFGGYEAELGHFFDVLNADGGVNFLAGYNVDTSDLDTAGGFTFKSFILDDGTLRIIATVPEPTTATLGLLGICGLAARRRRRA